MRVNELRIGNFILDSYTRDNKKVTVDTLVSIECMGTDTKYQPIPLTEEWLIKFGMFRLTEKRDKWYNQDDGVFSFNGKIECSDYFITTEDFKLFYFCIATIDDGMESWECLKRITNIHTLQNLYFALTNEELTI